MNTTTFPLVRAISLAEAGANISAAKDALLAEVELAEAAGDGNAAAAFELAAYELDDVLARLRERLDGDA